MVSVFGKRSRDLLISLKVREVWAYGQPRSVEAMGEEAEETCISADWESYFTYFYLTIFFIIIFIFIVCIHAF